MMASVKLEAVVSVVMGQAPAATDCNKEGRGTPFVKVGEFGADRPIIREWTTDPKKLAQKSDVLICVVGATCGKINLGADCAIGRSVAAIRPAPDKLDQRYLWYFMQGKVLDMRALSQGAAQTVITRQMISDTEIPLPSLPEQRRIVAILDEALKEIEAATANTKRSAIQTRDLLKRASAKILADDGDCWEVVTFEQVCEISSKLVDPRMDEFVDLAHVGAGNIESGTGELKNVLTAREEALISGKFLFDPTMVLYSKIRPYLMKACRPDFAGLCSADVYPLSPKTGKLDRDFLFHILLSSDFTAYAEAGSARAGMPKVNREHLFAYRFKLPPTDKQLEIAAKIDAMAEACRELCGLLERKLWQLDELKQSLLARAFSGELTAPPSAAANDNDFSTPEQVANILAVIHWRHENVRRDKTYGHVKAQKALHLVEHIGGVELGRKPIKDAAGPNDFEHMKRAEKWAKEHLFFEFVERPGGYDFRKLPNYSKMLSAAQHAVQPIEGALDCVNNLIVSMDSETAEVLATVHAAWNNLLSDGREPTPDAIVREARDDWHQSKLNIPENKFREAIGLIKASGIVPDGSAKPVLHRQLSLL